MNIKICVDIYVSTEPIKVMTPFLTVRNGCFHTGPATLKNFLHRPDVKSPPLVRGGTSWVQLWNNFFFTSDRCKISEWVGGRSPRLWYRKNYFTSDHCKISRGVTNRQGIPEITQRSDVKFFQKKHLVDQSDGKIIFHCF